MQSTRSFFLALSVVPSIVFADPVFGNALQFDGQNDFAVVPTTSFLPGGNFPYTEECWVFIRDFRPYQGGYNAFLLSRGDEASLHGCHVVVLNHNIGVTHWGRDTDTGVALSAYRWHHLATTWSGSVERVYLDGNLMWSNTYSALSVAGGSFTFGKHDNYTDATNGYYFSGLLDEVGVWNRVLNQSEIQNHMLTQISPLDPGLVGYWNFDEPNGQSLFDLAKGQTGRLGATASAESSDPVRVRSSVGYGHGLGSSVAGEVHFSGLVTSVNPPTPVQLEFRLPGEVLPVMVVSAALDSIGRFSFANSPEAGVYDLSVKHSHWLRRTLRIDNSSSVAGLVFELINGDCDGDNEVTLADYSLLSNAFGSAVGDPNWNSNADLDGDGEVSLGDYSILASSFGQTGDE